jgi:hypothetical protein
LLQFLKPSLDNQKLVALFDGDPIQLAMKMDKQHGSTIPFLLKPEFRDALNFSRHQICCL